MSEVTQKDKQNPGGKDELENVQRKQLIVFRQGDSEYALSIDQIKEVVITPRITKMPQTPSFVKGVANIRGNIIAILDLEEKFGIKDEGEPVKGAHDLSTDKNFTLVIESEDYKMGVLVKEVPNTLSVPVTAIEEGVNIVHDSSVEQNYINGIVKYDDRLIVLINVLKVINQSEKNLINKVAN
ncbi:chemotaxis protein CheW [Mangrovivirga sp. M17]|uniref:Chemotaxis protein CheW n=1 Tax=Mangrovivirga halotolerans TaxID=2993936 RepID=A0ABT3RNN5_9BACT|nr:chemotaxis protein CheW [Mangrovivirga halotolerans]MCX2743202.1 chemotaxis protein CheW [Mangrovivirga halotolerans]